MSVQPKESISELWTRWQGHVIKDVFPLRRYLGSSPHSGVFLTELTAREPCEVAIKLTPAASAFAKSQRSHWEEGASLAHPHLIGLLEAGEWSLDGVSHLYVVMEYADQTLAQLLGYRSLTADEAREMLGPVLEALAFLHNRNLVQGQLKPANVLVVGDQLKLASDTIRPVGVSGGGKGVLLYDPPETRDGTSSTAGDIWALGVSLFEAFTRRLPSGLDDRRGNILLPAEIPEEFRGIIGRCLSRRPYDRPKIAELQAWVSGRSALPDLVDAPRSVAVAEVIVAEAAGTQVAGPEAGGPVPVAVADETANTRAVPDVAANTPAASGALKSAPTGVSIGAGAPPARAAFSARVPSATLSTVSVSPPALSKLETRAVTRPNSSEGIRPASSRPAPAAAATAAPPRSGSATSGSAAPARPAYTATRPPAPTPKAGASATVTSALEAAIAQRRAARQDATQPSAARQDTTPLSAARQDATQRPAAPQDATQRPAAPQVATQRPAARQEPTQPSAVRPVPSPQPSSAPGPAPRRWQLVPLLLGIAALVILTWTGLRISGSAVSPPPAQPIAVVPAVPAPPPMVAPENTTPTALDPAPPPSPPPPQVHEEIPDVPQGTLQNIRGHIRVSVRVIVNQHGEVFAALADAPGPSRYFERLAVEAAKKWTFPAEDTGARRLMQIRFDFSREGATADAVVLQ